MKTVLLVIEGATGAPAEELGNRTALEVARCPAAERLAREGRCGWMNTSSRASALRPESLLAELCGSPDAEATLLQRGPAEVAAEGLDTAGFTHAACGNFVTLDGEQVRDPCVSRLNLEETRVLANVVQDRFDPTLVRLIVVAPARLVALVRDTAEEDFYPGHPALQESDVGIFSSRLGGSVFRRMLEESGRALSSMTLNEVRLDLGENPATHLWLWGTGPLRPMSRRPGVILSNSRMAQGVARLAGMASDALRDPWSGNADDAAYNHDRIGRALTDHSFCALYIEAPRDPAGYGPVRDKVRLLERLDLQFITPLVARLESEKDARLVLMADATRLPPGETPAARVPVIVWRHGEHFDGALRWDETACQRGLMGRLTPTRIHEALKGEA